MVKKTKFLGTASTPGKAPKVSRLKNTLCALWFGTLIAGTLTSCWGKEDTRTPDHKRHDRTEQVTDSLYASDAYQTHEDELYARHDLTDAENEVTENYAERATLANQVANIQSALSEYQLLMSSWSVDTILVKGKIEWLKIQLESITRKYTQAKLDDVDLWNAVISLENEISACEEKLDQILKDKKETDKSNRNFHRNEERNEFN